MSRSFVFCLELRFHIINRALGCDFRIDERKNIWLCNT